MKLLWCSDVHLNFLTEVKRREFHHEIINKNVDAVVISGDIAESHNIVQLVTDMQDHVDVPVYFVCGNHDFYGSSIAQVKRSVKTLGYLSSAKIVALNASTALVGVDGWGDCRYGDYENSRLTMSDWLYIDDLRKGYGKGMDELRVTLQALADKDAADLAKKVRSAIKAGHTKIFIVTHVPPFEEACLHAGKKSTPSGLPFFASKILGETILPIVKKNPQIEFIWLSGHTHSRAEYVPIPNLTVKVAHSEYYFPQIEQIFEV